MTPHIITLADFMTMDAAKGLAMIGGLFLGMGSLVAIMLTR